MPTLRRMPALFLGHGSPMNVLENNRYTQTWRRLGEQLPRPQAILAISAHWYTRGTRVTAMVQPPTVHDFHGFPRALHETVYPAPGSPRLARRISELLAPQTPVVLDDDWGLDHGSWSLLLAMYPQADIPVVQLSIDGTLPVSGHLELGRKLAVLRDEGVLIVASGNVVHNLQLASWSEPLRVYPWAQAFNDFVKDNLRWRGAAGQHPLANYLLAEGGALACPTPEHFLPLLYTLGAWEGTEPVTLPVEGIEMGSLSMLSVQVGG